MFLNFNQAPAMEPGQYLSMVGHRKARLTAFLPGKVE
jgi:hypothetical protein